MVGFVMICYGVCISISSFVFGMMVRITGIQLIFVLGKDNVNAIRTSRKHTYIVLTP